METAWGTMVPIGLKTHFHWLNLSDTLVTRSSMTNRNALWFRISLMTYFHWLNLSEILVRELSMTNRNALWFESVSNDAFSLAKSV